MSNWTKKFTWFPVALEMDCEQIRATSDFEKVWLKTVETRKIKIPAILGTRDLNVYRSIGSNWEPDNKRKG